MTVDEFFARLWQQYCAITPQAERIHRLFEQLDGHVFNDHVAFRTFAESPIDITALEPVIIQLGYQRDQEYHFPEKKLRAYSYLPDNPGHPRIFLSELRWREFSKLFESEVSALIRQIPPDSACSPEVFWHGTLWSMPGKHTFEILEKESEYAAWLSVWGLQANHFTVSVSHLTQTGTLQKVVELMHQHGIKLNESGGIIKGSPGELLEQASTMADSMTINFADGPGKVPSCYYEFARRYPTPNGALYQGFIAASADKIFESTHRS